MNVLYLKGLKSSHNSPKVVWLSEIHKVYNPPLDYKNKNKFLFKELEQIIIQKEINFIVGSSMGAYLGFFFRE